MLPDLASIRTEQAVKYNSDGDTTCLGGICHTQLGMSTLRRHDGRSELRHVLSIASVILGHAWDPLKIDAGSRCRLNITPVHLCDAGWNLHLWRRTCRTKIEQSLPAGAERSPGNRERWRSTCLAKPSISYSESSKLFPWLRGKLFAPRITKRRRSWAG